MREKTQMREAPEAFTRFRDAIKTILSVPHSEIQKRIAERRKEVDANPNR